jgi:hypothetical protein
MIAQLCADFCAHASSLQLDVTELDRLHSCMDETMFCAVAEVSRRRGEPWCPERTSPDVAPIDKRLPSSETHVSRCQACARLTVTLSSISLTLHLAEI